MAFSDSGRPTFAYFCASLHTGSSPEAWRGIQETAEALDVQVLAFPGGRLGGRDDFESLRNRVYSLPQAPVIDGVLSWVSSLSGIRGPGEVAALHRRFEGLPLVTLSDPLPGRPCVRFDVVTGMGALMDHLVEVHGYRDFAFIRGPESHQSAQARYAAFRDSLTRHGLVFREDLVSSPLGWDRGKDALAELLDRRGKVPGRDFAAVVTASDLLAFSILRDLQRRGYRVPSDTAVVGFNDTAESRIATPPLTTVSLRFHDQASEGLRRLYDLWRGAPVTGDTLLPTSPVFRQSCGCRSQELVRAAEASGPASFEGLGFTASEIRAWIEPLRDTLDLPPGVHRDRRFLDLLERILERVNTHRFPASIWQTVLSELRGCLPVLDRGLEDLFGQARILVGEAAVREFSFRQWLRDQKAEQVRALGRALQGAHDPRRLAEILDRRLPDLGFRSGWLVRREREETSDRAVLLGWFSDRGQVDLPTGGLDFAVSSLLPQGTWPERRLTLVFEPLYYREHSLGYLVLEALAGESPVYEELRTSISAALNTALLLNADAEVRHDHVFDPNSLVETTALVLPPGFDRLPYCIGDPGKLTRMGREAPEPVLVELDGPALRLVFGNGALRLSLPTLAGEPGSLEGDQLVVLAEAPVEPGFLAALEEITALGSLVLDPGQTPIEAFATLRPPLCVVDLEAAGNLTLRTLALLGTDPGWRSVPFLAFPPRGRAALAGGGRGLLEVLQKVRAPVWGTRVLFVGVAPPEASGGMDFTSVPSGLQAIPLLQQEPAEAVVVFSGGGGFRGLDLVEFLSSDPAHSGVRVLVLAEPGLRPDEWVRLEAHPRVTVQVDGVWSPTELTTFLDSFVHRPGDASARVKKSLAWLVEHHSQDIARWQLADYLSVSEDHLTRDFRRELGLTPWEFLSRYRIGQAKKALADPERRLADIAREVGYHDQSYFCRVFRKETGTTPQRYRELAKRMPG